MSKFQNFNLLFDMYNICRKSEKTSSQEKKVPCCHHYLYPGRGCPDVTEHWTEARWYVPAGWPHCLSATKRILYIFTMRFQEVLIEADKTIILRQELQATASNQIAKCTPTTFNNLQRMAFVNLPGSQMHSARNRRYPRPCPLVLRSQMGTWVGL